MNSDKIIINRQLICDPINNKYNLNINQTTLSIKCYNRYKESINHVKLESNYKLIIKSNSDNGINSINNSQNNEINIISLDTIN